MRGLGAQVPLRRTSAVATASGQRDRWQTPLPGEWQKLPKGKKGGPEGRYQVAGYNVSPAFEAEGVAGQEYHLVLCKGEIRLLDKKGGSAGFQQNFSSVADEDGLVVFPQPQIKRIGDIRKTFEACEVGIAGSELPTQKRSRTRKGPKQELFPFWVCVRTAPMGNKPAVEIPVTDAWRFELKTKIEQINDEAYLEWRFGDTMNHNTMALTKNGARMSEDTAGDDTTEPLLKRQESASSSAGSSAVAPATTRLPETFGEATIYFQLQGRSKITLQVDSTTEISFAALVKAIVGTLLTFGRFSRGMDSLDVAYERMLVDGLRKQLADPAETKLLFGGESLTPDDMAPLTSLVEQLRVVVIVTTEAVIKDFDVLRGIRNPFPATGFQALFPEEDSLAGTVPMAPGSSPLASDASIELVGVNDEPAEEGFVKDERALPPTDVSIEVNVKHEPAGGVFVKEEFAPPASDVFIELPSVEDEPAGGVFVKEERLLGEDIALIREFFLRSPDQRKGSIVERVDPTDCTLGVVVAVDEVNPYEVCVLFDDAEEVESNLKVGEDVLLVELRFL